jgi:hypothetical protein
MKSAWAAGDFWWRNVGKCCCTSAWRRKCCHLSSTAADGGSAIFFPPTLDVFFFNFQAQSSASRIK